jgi:hypothetical protein
MKSLYVMVLLLIVLLGVAQPSFAQVEAPTIVSAKFDHEGKLLVRGEFEAIAGCYLALNGGLSMSSISTGITSTQLTESQANKGTVTLRTKRRYYCKKRTLYVNLELVCLNSVIGSATSAGRSVSVPITNLKR